MKTNTGKKRERTARKMLPTNTRLENQIDQLFGFTEKFLTDL